MITFLAVCYGFIAGLRTVGDVDVGWQIATGRWIIAHHQVPSIDVLSFTASGQPWIYPALSQMILYLLHLAGGFTLLSWAGALLCAGTVFVLARRNAVAATLAAIAVPLIAIRTSPRAEMFTEILFAIFAVVLWRFHRTGTSSLWLLPALMALWVNLHLGFIAGLALCAAYVVMELGDGILNDGGRYAYSRLQKAATPLITTALATLINPWGPFVYKAIYRQSQILQIHSSWIVEWRSVRLTPSRVVREAFNWTQPESALWWMLAIAVISAAIAAFRKRPVAAALLLFASYVTVQSIRMKGPFAVIVVVLGGSILADAIESGWLRAKREHFKLRLSPALSPALLVCLVVAFVVVRSSALVSNRYYLQHPSEMSAFGAGASSWYPTEAVKFLVSEKLPGNVFNDFTTGGFFAGQVSPEPYPDYIDGRSIPFSGEQFFRSFRLLGLSLDSPEWTKEADAYRINTIFVSVDPNIWGGLTNLGGWCRAKGWKPVYVDTHAAVFVRESPETEALIHKYPKDCASFTLPDAQPGRQITKADRFNYQVNAAAIYLALGRNDEARARIDAAEVLFSDNAYVHYVKGLLLGFSGDLSAGESELKRSLEIQPGVPAAYALAKLLSNQERSSEAEQVLRAQIDLVDDPSGLYVELGKLQAARSRPREAIESFEKAERLSIYRDGAEVLGGRFYAQLNAGRAVAWMQSGQTAKALESMRRAVAYDPSDAELQEGLEQMSRAAGADTMGDRQR